MAGSKSFAMLFIGGPLIFGFILPRPCLEAAIIWPISSGFIFIILHAVVSMPTRLSDASTRFIILDLPFAGPFPSIAIVASMTAKFGLTVSFMPAITSSRCR